MWLIIGYGNLLRGDDGAGPILAEELADYFTSTQAKIIITHQLTPELALEISAPEVQRVLFIDVKRDQSTSVNITQLQPDASGSCGHQHSPQLLLQLAAQLYHHSVPGWLLTIAGEEFSFADQLSDSTKKASKRAFLQAVAFIEASVRCSAV